MTEIKKINLLDLDRDGMTKFITDLGEKSFRVNQIMKWIYQFGVTDFFQMTNINKALQEKLSQIAEIRAPEIMAESASSDGTIKWALDAGDGQLIETVYIPDVYHVILHIFIIITLIITTIYCFSKKTNR